MQKSLQDTGQVIHKENSTKSIEGTNSGNVAAQLVGDFVEISITSRAISTTLSPNRLSSYASHIPIIRFLYIDEVCYTGAALFSILEDFKISEDLEESRSD